MVFNLLQQKRIQLNSSPIDELGEGTHESGWWCQVKCEHRAGHAGIDGNPESGNHHQALSHSVEILTNLAPVVQTVDYAIQRINHYPLDIAIGFAITYPVDSDLSGG